MLRTKLRRVIAAGIDLIEFSMDAGDAETYAVVRPPHRGGPPRDPQKWWSERGRTTCAPRSRCARSCKAPTRIVVSIIRQEQIEGKLDAAIDFWIKEVGVDEVITRKFLTWDDNTHIEMGHALDPHLYRSLPTQKTEPCVWPFERLNVDTLGRIALCGQDISFRTAELFPNANDVSIKEIWQGERFNWYRRMHLEGRGAEAFPCRGCSAWFAGIRDWDHGWLKVLKTSGDHLKEVMRKDLGVEVEIYEPDCAFADRVPERRATLVPLDRPHLARTREWANDPELMRLMDRQQPVSAAEHEAWFASLPRRDDCAYFAIETVDEPRPRRQRLAVGRSIGGIARRSCAWSSAIGGARQGAGRGGDRSALPLRLRAAGSAPHLRVRAGINPAARRAFERAGFALEGTLRDDRWAVDRFIDSYLLARVNDADMLHVIYDGQCGFCVRSLKVCRALDVQTARCGFTMRTRGSRCFAAVSRARGRRFRKCDVCRRRRTAASRAASSRSGASSGKAR